jgi:rare lipoprotein A
MVRRIIAAVLSCAIFVPSVAFAAEPITRRDGFLLLWNSVRRALEETRETPFVDVKEGEKGFAEIRYAKRRGILDDEDEKFYPNDPLLTRDAVLWLLRTRSVDDIDDLTLENLQNYSERFPFLYEREFSASISEEELLSLMRTMDEFLKKEEHEVSLYSEKFHGKGTAFGESFDMNAMTAAHRTFPYNTLVKVTNVANGKSVTIRVNDRGPFVEGRDMDLSLGAFTSIEERSKGVLHATFERLGDANLVNKCDDTARPLIRIGPGTRLIGGIPHMLELGGTLVLRANKTFVLRSVTYPDGNTTWVEDWILPGEKHEITPSIAGEYLFVLSDAKGRYREARMLVSACDH